METMLHRNQPKSADTESKKSSARWTLHSTAASVCGTRHDRDEDYVLAEDPAGIYAVADGVGGHKGGAEASEFLCSVMTEELLETDTGGDFDLRDAKRAMRHAIGTAMDGMSQLVRKRPELNHMSTTIALGWVVDGRLYYAHAGDSRLYLLRSGVLLRLTDDHSFAEMMRDVCGMTDEALRRHPYRNLITRSIGPASHDSRLDVSSLCLRPGDRMIFLTDGVTDFLDNESIERMANETGCRGVLSELLLENARKLGAYDDLSCVIVDCESTEHQDELSAKPHWWHFNWMR